MILNSDRIGTITSSEIVNIMGAPKPLQTYISECNMERRLGRAIESESNARALTWGKVLEKRCFDLLGYEYQLISKETIKHPKIDYWSGSPDGVKKDTVIDIKCPMTLKSFCTLIDPIYDGLVGLDAMNAIRNGYTDSTGIKHDKHKDGEKFYWQLVSNAILTDSKFAELIIYCPYLSELQDVRTMCNDLPPQELYKAYWIVNSNDEELPYLLDGNFYQNLNCINFEVPQSDKDLLISKVVECGSNLFKIQEQLAKQLSTDTIQLTN